MSIIEVCSLETEFRTTESNIADLLFHFDINIFKIRKYQENINILIGEDKDYRLALQDLVDCTKAFEEISSKLLILFDKSYYIGREIGAPVNINYRILAKHLKDPSTYIPRGK